MWERRLGRGVALGAAFSVDVLAQRRLLLELLEYGGGFLQLVQGVLIASGRSDPTRI